MPRAKDVTDFTPEEWVETLLHLSPDLLRKELEGFVAKDPGYPTDPVEFMKDVLHVTPWKAQEDISRMLQNTRSTVVFSGFGVGKTYLSACLVAWWMCTRKPATVITLAPTWLQVNQLLWRYIRQLAKNASLPPEIFDSPNWKISPEVFAMGLSPRKTARDTQGAQELATTIQGYHSANMLVILDEAAGLPRMVFDAARGLAVSENDRVLAIGNPIAQNGPFWDAMQSPMWGHIHISSLDHPNVITGENVIPGAVSRSYISEVAEECPRVAPDSPNAISLPWNPDRWFLPSNLFKSKVLGYAPEESEDQLIPMSWVVEAQQRTYGSMEFEPVVLGLDPARHGTDDSVICARQGGQVLWTRRYHGQDSVQMAAWLKRAFEDTDAVKGYIDEIGVGAGAVDQARILGLPVMGIGFGRAAFQRTRFANLRAECWWRVRDALQQGYLALPPLDSLLAGDLTALKYRPDAMGRILMESKEEIAKRIGRSPDAGDALALTFTLAQTFGRGNEVMQSTAEGLMIDSRWNIITTENEPASRWGMPGMGRRSGWSRRR